VFSGRIMPFEIASPLQYIMSRKWLQTSRNSLLGSDKLDKLVQPSYMLCTQFKPLALLKALN